MTTIIGSLFLMFAAAFASSFSARIGPNIVSVCRSALSREFVRYMPSRSSSPNP